MAECISRGLKFVIIFFLIMITILCIVNYIHFHEVSKGTCAALTANTGTTMKWLNLFAGIISGLLTLFMIYDLFVGEAGREAISASVGGYASAGYGAARQRAVSAYDTTGRYLGETGGIIPASRFQQPIHSDIIDHTHTDITVPSRTMGRRVGYNVDPGF